MRKTTELRSQNIPSDGRQGLCPKLYPDFLPQLGLMGKAGLSFWLLARIRFLVVIELK
jgi:hypothetical protein